MTGSDSATTTRRAARGRLAVAGLGGVYLLLAVAGFVRTGLDDFGYEEPVRLLGILGTSTLLNVVHTALGAVATVAALRRAASAFAIGGVVAFTAMAVFGAVARIFGGRGDPLNLTWWNVGLYLCSAVVCGWVCALRLRTPR